MPCCHSTTEGEPELYPNKGSSSHPILSHWEQLILHSHSVAVIRDLAVDMDRGLDIIIEGTEHANINNDNTHSSDTTVALGGPEVVGHPEDPAYNNQDRLTVLTSEINDLHQRVAVREGQPAETLDHIQCELQNLLIAIHQPQPPALAEPLGEVLCQYMDTLCSTQKQSNLTNSLMQDIPVWF